jgi:hypothetical protein
MKFIATASIHPFPLPNNDGKHHYCRIPTLSQSRSAAAKMKIIVNRRVTLCKQPNSDEKQR